MSNNPFPPAVEIAAMARKNLETWKPKEAAWLREVRKGMLSQIRSVVLNGGTEATVYTNLATLSDHPESINCVCQMLGQLSDELRVAGYEASVSNHGSSISASWSHLAPTTEPEIP